MVDKRDKNVFISRLGRFTMKEKEWLKETTSAPSGCLHCACGGKADCKLRLYATEAGIKRPRYEVSSMLPVKEKIHVKGRMWFERLSVSVAAYVFTIVRMVLPLRTGDLACRS